MTLSARTVLIVAWVGLMLGAGCQRQASDFGGQRDPIPGFMIPRVRAIEGLKDTLYFGDPIEVREPGRPLSVTVQVANDAHVADLHVQYRFEFYDKYQRPIQPLMGWKTMHLQHKAPQPVTASATDLGAVEWNVTFRRDR